MKPSPLLMLRPPSKALVAESPNAHMRDLELESMSQAAVSTFAIHTPCPLLAPSHVCWQTPWLLYYCVAVHVHVHVSEQARGVSSYVSAFGSSSMSETSTTTGFSFLGFSNKTTKVFSRKSNTRAINPPLNVSVFRLLPRPTGHIDPTAAKDLVRRKKPSM